MSVEYSEANWKRTFFTIWTGQAFSLLGSKLVQFALVWWLTRTTGSATVLATATLVALLPDILLGPFAGALVDRWNRKKVMLIADGMVALATLGLNILFMTGVVQPWHIYLILTLRSLGGAFQWPAMQASTSLMVPQEQLSRVAGMNQALQGALGIAAPPLGALLLGMLPMQAVLSVDILTAVMAILPLLFAHIPQPAQTQIAPGQSAVAVFWQDFTAGLNYVRAWPGLLMLAVMSTLINFMLTPAFSLTPLLVTQHFHGTVYDLGWMDSAIGAGVIVGGLGLGIWGGFRRRIATSLLGLVGIGISTLIIGLTPGNAFYLGVAGMLLTGIMLPITNGPLQAVVQSTVAADMQGRVMTLIQSMAMAISPLSMAIAGPVSDNLGISFWYILGGLVCMTLGAAAFFIPGIMNIEKGRAAGRPTSAAAEMPAD